LIREGLARLLGRYPDIDVVAAGATLDPSWVADVIVAGQGSPPAVGRVVVLEDVIDVAALADLVRSRGAQPSGDVRPAHSRVTGRLTARERSVLRGLSDGKSTAAIGSALNISPRTVERHQQTARAKLDAPNQVGAVARALELGLLDDAV